MNLPQALVQTTKAIHILVGAASIAERVEAAYTHGFTHLREPGMLSNDLRERVNGLHVRLTAEVVDGETGGVARTVAGMNVEDLESIAEEMLEIHEEIHSLH